MSIYGIKMDGIIRQHLIFIDCARTASTKIRLRGRRRQPLRDAPAVVKWVPTQGIAGSFHTLCPHKKARFRATGEPIMPKKTDAKRPASLIDGEKWVNFPSLGLAIAARNNLPPDRKNVARIKWGDRVYANDEIERMQRKR